MLFLGLGTGLGSSLIVDGIVEPMELGHLPYKKGTYGRSYVRQRGIGGARQREVAAPCADVVAQLIAALEPDEVVLGGGNAKELREEPPRNIQLWGQSQRFSGRFSLVGRSR